MKGSKKSQGQRRAWENWKIKKVEGVQIPDENTFTLRELTKTLPIIIGKWGKAWRQDTHRTVYAKYGRKTTVIQDNSSPMMKLSEGIKRKLKSKSLSLNDEGQDNRFRACNNPSNKPQPPYCKLLTNTSPPRGIELTLEDPHAKWITKMTENKFENIL